MKCPTLSQTMIEKAKQSKYGGVWYSPNGLVYIQNDGKFGYFGKKISQMAEDKWQEDQKQI